jgi:DNA-binding MarR family transcriptional regulator
MAGETEALKEAIDLAVRRFTADVALFNHEVSRRLKLGPNESRFVTLLQMHGPLTPGRLSELSGLRSGTVTGVIDRLEEAGYAARGRDEADRRRVIVTLDQERIAKKLDPLCAPQVERLRSALDRFTREELWTIADFLARIVDPALAPAKPD